MSELEKYSDLIIQQIALYVPRLILALITLVVGLWLVRVLVRTAENLARRRRLDASLQTFLMSLLSIGLKAVVIITIAGMIGIEVASLIAMLGAAGLAIGLALTGTLQNFAGGAIILILKPFIVGDVIETGGVIGSVRAIQIFHTVLTTADNKTIIIPNSELSNATLVNYTTQATRRLELTFDIGYAEDIDHAKSVIRRTLEADARILLEPAPNVAVSALADSSVKIVSQFWVAKEDYWPVNFATLEAVKKAFDSDRISIPFPQRDVHLHSA